MLGGFLLKNFNGLYFSSTNNHLMGYKIEQFPIKNPEKNIVYSVNKLANEIIEGKVLSKQTYTNSFVGIFKIQCF